MTVESSVIPRSSDADNVTLEKANNALQIKETYESNHIIRPVAESQIDIIELQANATLTGLTHDSMISDTMNDATGYKNTVQTGTTTAAFSTNKYIAAGSSELKDSVTDGTQRIAYGHDAANKYSGATFVAGSNFTLNKIDLEMKYMTGAPTGNSVLKIYAVDGSIHPTGAALATSTNTLAHNTLTADYAWYSFNFAGLALTVGTTYMAILVSDSATGVGAYPNYQAKNSVTGAMMAYSADGSSWSYTADRALNIKTYGALASADGIVDISLGTISGTVTHTELVCNCPDRETGDSVTYKLKNATQEDDALALNTKNALSNLTSNPTGIEIKLTPKTGSPTAGYPSMKSYCLKIWKS
jgi:hypothetical protein